MVYGEQHAAKEMFAVNQAFEEFKRYLLSPPLLHTPKADEKLSLYLAVLEIAASGVLVREEQDGASNVKGSGIGIVLMPPTGITVRQSIKTAKLTNNEADYEAIITSPELDKSMGVEVIETKCDSLLVVNQVNKTIEAREGRMQRYLGKLHVTLHRFKEWILQHVPREQNSEADALANLESSVEEDEISSSTIV
ncbi:PREDICTED: uncharacterized protein LOC109229847 [Nicotiana attenuata]|uniref:uncharacterized protein LOC109229847 n=1 Tax=Nicotiana attenuata TaxID=49451 RepID=UPI0009055BC2|nr:PREDICTED: uncharacterized protein LOC109229847 [Nicotiana attenuata]